MANQMKQLIAAIFLVALFASRGLVAPAAKAPTGPPTIYGAQLPAGAEKLQIIAGSASYKVPEEVRQVEKFYRGLFESAKDVAITERTVGASRMVLFMDRGQRPWSTIQITGVVGERKSFLVICSDRPAQIDQFP